MTKEYLEAFKNLKQELYYSPNQIPDIDKWHEVIEEALQRLEQIDNANPSEALKCLENIEADLTGLPKHVTEYDDGFDNYLEDIWYNIDAVKQVLLKAQEQKKYLKWEDLEFDDEEQRMNVSLNGHPHLLCYYRNMFGSLCMIDNTGITIWEDNKNFFNDLHLEIAQHGEMK